MRTSFLFYSHVQFHSINAPEISREPWPLTSMRGLDLRWPVSRMKDGLPDQEQDRLNFSLRPSGTPLVFSVFSFSVLPTTTTTHTNFNY